MLNNQILISVIVPAYNIEKYIGKTLDSILVQTHHNLEIIVVDDGSTDKTPQIIDSYARKDERVKVIHKENSGVSDTRNKGIEASSGDYIGFVDGDDWIDPRMYEQLLKNALECHADISHCGFQMVYPSRTVQYYNTGEKRLQTGKKGVIDLISNNKIEPSIANKLFKKEIIRGLKMDTDLKINEDLLFNVWAFDRAEKAVFEDIPLYHYILRQNSAATSQLNLNKLMDPVAAAGRILSFYQNDPEVFPYALKKYISVNIAAYHLVTADKSGAFTGLDKTLRNNLKAVKKQSGKAALPFKIKLERGGILYVPPLYRAAVRILRALSGNKNQYEVK